MPIIRRISDLFLIWLDERAQERDKTLEERLKSKQTKKKHSKVTRSFDFIWYGFQTTLTAKHTRSIESITVSETQKRSENTLASG